MTMYMSDENNNIYKFKHTLSTIQRIFNMIFHKSKYEIEINNL